MKIAAYITAYEDPDAVQECLAGIEQQSYPVEAIIIVDNSAQHPSSSSTLDTTLPLVIHSYPNNIGVAGGLRVGLAWAMEQNYDFLWTFDQDSIPSADCLEQLVNTYQHYHSPSYPLGIVAPTAIDITTQTQITGANFVKDQFVGYQPDHPTTPYECDAPITSGSLIGLSAAKTVFPHSPIAQLFIDGVDLEFGMSLKQAGYHNLIVPHALLYHHFGNPVIIQFLGQQKQIHHYSSLRHYYICRNYTYLSLRYVQWQYLIFAIKRRLTYLLKTSLIIALFETNSHQYKLKKTLSCWQGTLEGALLASNITKK